MQQRWLSQPTSLMYSMSLDLASASLQTLLYQHSDETVLTFDTGMADYLRSLQHFETATYATLGGAKVQNVMGSAVAQIAWQHPYLMHMVLAVSAAHLKRLMPKVSQPRQHKRYHEMEIRHWHTALKLYQAELSSTKALWKHNMDSIVATTFLATIFTFALEDELPIDFFDKAEPADMMFALNSLAASNGVKALQSSFTIGDGISIWTPIFRDADDKCGTHTSVEPGIRGIPTAFVELCEFNGESTSETNPYHAIVRMLVPLLQSGGEVEHFGRLIDFGGRTWPFWRPLLLEKDSRAMLLLAHYFTLLGTVDQWWLVTRSKSECAALVHYLSDDPDPRIQALLPYPATFGAIGTGQIFNQCGASEACTRSGNWCCGASSDGEQWSPAPLSCLANDHVELKQS